MNRSRVAPLKKVTVPRMEISAALVAVRVTQKVSEELNLDVEHFF